jgi:hypothetical protein
MSPNALIISFNLVSISDRSFEKYKVRREACFVEKGADAFETPDIDVAAVSTIPLHPLNL